MNKNYDLSKMFTLLSKISGCISRSELLMPMKVQIEDIDESMVLLFDLLLW